LSTVIFLSWPYPFPPLFLPPKGDREGRPYKDYDESVKLANRIFVRATLAVALWGEREVEKGREEK